MSSLKFHAPGGYGQAAQDVYGYSQAVRVGDRLELSGQGGWSQDAPFAFVEGHREQVDKAFENVDMVLKGAGGKGWEQVFRVRTYHLALDDVALKACKDNFAKWMPNHKPLWTCVEVTRLGIPGMLVEVEVIAYDP